MSITMTNVLQLYRDTLLADSALNTFCTTNFGGMATVYVGFNEAKPPGVSECPFIVISPEGLSDGPQVDEHSYRTVVYCGILKAELTTDTNLVEQDGLYLLDGFVEAVWAALEEASSNVPAVSRELQIDTQSQFPLLTASMRIVMQASNLLNGSMEL